ncbi:MAG TPA: hypothetical protein EYP10_03210, partial [Armatimonadetes bacterium]|nr:hypothetical protein [Armatimonadota bacterium]
MMKFTCAWIRMSMGIFVFAIVHVYAQGVSAMVRYDDAQVLSLDGIWNFATDPDGKLTHDALNGARGIRKIKVPACWEAQFDDLVDYDGVAWYWREFEVPKGWRGRRIRLQFDAVDYFARVWLNGHEIGAHEGGYLPFAWEVQDCIRFDSPNEIVVKVIDPSGDAKRFPEFPLHEVPNGKQSHYCNIGGIWQSVRLIAHPSNYILNILVTPDVKRKMAILRIQLRRPADVGTKVSISVRRIGARERPITVVRSVQRGESEVTVNVRFERVCRWSPDHPHLYRATVKLFTRDGVDCAHTTFGMRTVEVRDGKLLLNGVPVYFRAALDQAFYPDVIYGPPTDEMLKKQFTIGKRFGLNGLRVHIKIPTPKYLDWADRMGLMLWVDFPSWYRFNERVKQRVEEQVREWLVRDFNHPSIIAWCLVNEEWGINMDAREVREWLRKMYSLMKRLDPTRLVIDNSPAGRGHVISDIEDQHVYRNIPDRASDFENWVRTFAGHPHYTFRYPDSIRRGFEPLVVSEFGNWGLPDVNRLLEFYGGKEPYWFFQSAYRGPIYDGVLKFWRYHFDSVYGDLSGWARMTQAHQLESLKFEIETMRCYPSIVGYVITQFTDLNAESNGLMDMCRNPKALDDLRYCQRDTVVLARPTSPASTWWGGKVASFDVYVSHFGTNEPIRNATLRWWVEGTGLRGRVHGINVPAGDAGKVAAISFITPNVRKCSKLRLWMTVLMRGREIARNYRYFWAFPRAYRQMGKGTVHVWRTRGRLIRFKAYLMRSGYRVCDELSDDTIVIATHLDLELVKWLRDGGRVLLLAEGTDALGAIQMPLRIASRNEKGWWGDWATSFLWLRRDGMFEHV